MSTKQRRKRETLACAECRRLKLKCDRSWPCSTCVRRGCATICPKGVLAPARATRRGFAGAEQLYERIGELCERIAQLEHALELATTSDHPLLKPELLALKSSPEPASASQQDQAHDQTEAGMVADIHNQADQAPAEDIVNVPQTIPRLSYTSTAIQSIIKSLPSLSTLPQAVEPYFTVMGGVFLPVTPPAFQRIVQDVYNLPPHVTDTESVHKLALVCLILAISAILDGNFPSVCDAVSASERYYASAETLYTLRNPIESVFDVTIQGMLVRIVYMRLTTRHSRSWIVLGMLSKMVIGNNMHRNPAQWSTDMESVMLRQNVFWEIYSYDVVYSFIIGRATSFNPAFIDCPMPALDIDAPDARSKATANFYLWKWRFSSEVLIRVTESVFGCKTPSYSTVCELEALVRDSWVPECLDPEVITPTIDGCNSAARCMFLQQATILMAREMCIIYLHRGLMAVALSEMPDDPLQHRYSSSVIASFRSALKVATLLRDTMTGPPGSTGLHVLFWPLMFYCTVVLGTIAALSPQCTFSDLASTEFLLMVEILEVNPVPMPSKILPFLYNLKERVMIAVAGFPCREPEVISGVNIPEWEAFGEDEQLISQMYALHLADLSGIPHGGPTSESNHSTSLRLPDSTAQLHLPGSSISQFAADAMQVISATPDPSLDRTPAETSEKTWEDFLASIGLHA